MSKAVNKNVELMESCTNAEGCDRHLLGLKCAAQEQNIPLPKIFTDPSWKKRYNLFIWPGLKKVWVTTSKKVLTIEW